MSGKWQVLLIALLCAGVVSAEEMVAYVDQPTTVTTACIKNSQMRSNATASITIWYENGTIAVPSTASTPSGNGSFSFTHVFTQIGAYSTREVCDFNGVLADGSTLIRVKKPTFGNVQVIAQGVAQAELNTTIVSEWLVLLPNATGAANSTIVVQGGDCSVTGTSVVPSVTVQGDAVRATFIADPVDGFTEGANYPVVCNLTLSAGLQVNGVKSFVFINREVSFWQALLQLIGISQQTQATVNETLSITNQTLTIVQALNGTGSNTTGAQIYEQYPVVWVAQTNFYPGDTSPVVVLATLGSSDVQNATCAVTIYDSNTSAILETQDMTPVNGQYIYNWTVPEYADGNYPAKVNCTGGSFGTAKISKLQDIYVNGQVYMGAWS